MSAAERDQFFDGAVGDQLAAINKQYAIANPFRLFHVVSAVYHCRTSLRAAPNQSQDLLARLQIDADRRLIEHQHRGPMNDSAGEVETALHPARKRLHRVVGALPEPDFLQHPRTGLARRDARHALHPREVPNILRRAQTRVERERLRHQPEHAPECAWIGFRRLAIDQHAAAIGAHQR